ncbi:MAG: ATPase, partial [Candidatus Binatia bacterium]
VPDQPSARAETVSESIFRRDADFWTILYEGTSVRLKDSKGLQYLAELIRRQGEDIHAADLSAGGPSAVGAEPVRDRGDAGEILDVQARSEYRQRLQDLQGELEEATRWSDVGRAARITEEIEFLKDELSSAFGIGGRARKAGDTTERARKAVASRIRDSIERIGKENRTLALHFENAIRTGAFCSYRPDRSSGWKL